MKNNKILIIDDDLFSIENITETLKDINPNFEIASTDDSAEGLKMAVEIEPDLILLDYNLPHINGYEIIEELIKRDIASKVIIISGYIASIQDIIKFTKIGANDLLIKPYNEADLITSIKRALTLNNKNILQNGNSNSLIEKLTKRVSKLDKENDILRTENNELRIRNNILEHKIKVSNIIVKLTYLAFSTLIIIILKSYEIVANVDLLITYAIIIFLFLLIPFGRLKIISAKYKDIETKFKMSDGE